MKTAFKNVHLGILALLSRTNNRPSSSDVDALLARNGWTYDEYTAEVEAREDYRPGRQPFNGLDDKRMPLAKNRP